MTYHNYELNYELNYFKPSGKWYTSGRLAFPEDMYELVRYIKEHRKTEGILPGLSSGIWLDTIVISCEGSTWMHVVSPHVEPLKPPGWEYKTVEDVRKGSLDIDIYLVDGWELDPDAGREGESWDRFSCHEEYYLRRKIDATSSSNTSAER